MPSSSATRATTLSAGRSGVAVATEVSTVICRWPAAARRVRASVTLPALSKTTSAAVATPGNPSPIDTSGTRCAMAAQCVGPRVDGQRDQGVDALVDQALGQRGLELRVVGRVDDQGTAAGLEQPASERRRQALLPDVLQRPAEHTDVAGAAGRQRSGDGVGLIAEAFSRLADPLLGLRRHLQPAQGVRKPPPWRARSRRRCRAASGAVGVRPSGQPSGSTAGGIDKPVVKRFTGSHQ